MIRRASINEIIDATCAALRVQRGELLSSRRHERIVLARSIIALLARRLTLMSYPEIASAMGRRHHSGSCTAHARLQRIMDRERRLAPHERLITRFVNVIEYRVERGREAAA